MLISATITFLLIELIAHHRSNAQIAAAIGADAVFYNELDDLQDAVRSINPSVLKVCSHHLFHVSSVTKHFLS